MGQTTELFPSLKKNYRRAIRSPKIDSLATAFLEFSVNIVARVKGLSFPKKFNWEWKLEMLLSKYEITTTKLFRKTIKPGMIVVDIGAHIGYYTLLFSKLVGKTGHVYAFEADTENFSLLSKNTKGFKNITIINKAISDKNGSIEFYKIIKSTGCHSIVQPKEEYEKYTVPSVTLDAFMMENEIRNIDAIKIDIEGGEPLAFQGMEKLFKKSRNLMIVSEFSPKSISNMGINPEDFLRKIRSSGFGIYQISGNAGLERLDIENLKDLEFYKTGYTNLVYKK